MERVDELVAVVIAQSGNSKSIQAIMELMKIRITGNLSDADLELFFTKTLSIRERFNVVA